MVELTCHRQYVFLGDWSGFVLEKFGVKDGAGWNPTGLLMEVEAELK